AKPDSDASVHLCAFPEADEALIDNQLSNVMNSLLRLVSLGSAARNIAKIKVRQPLAMLEVEGDWGFERAVELFKDQLCDELNLRDARFHKPKSENDRLLT